MSLVGKKIACPKSRPKFKFLCAEMSPRWNLIIWFTMVNFLFFLEVSCEVILYGVSIWQINEFVKRARAAKIHAYIISHLKKEMPAMIGKAKTQQRLIDNLLDEFGKVSTLCPVCLKLCCLVFFIYFMILYILQFCQSRFKGSSIYLREISQMLSTSRRSWVATILISLRS